MKAESYIAYFHRYGERDWVLKVRGRPAKLTAEIVWRGATVRTQIRRRQPRAVTTGRGRIQYTRRLTIIEAP